LADTLQTGEAGCSRKKSARTKINVPHQTVSTISRSGPRNSASGDLAPSFRNFKGATIFGQMVRAAGPPALRSVFGRVPYENAEYQSRSPRPKDQGDSANQVETTLLEEGIRGHSCKKGQRYRILARLKNKRVAARTSLAIYSLRAKLRNFVAAGMRLPIPSGHIPAMQGQTSRSPFPKPVINALPQCRAASRQNGDNHVDWLDADENSKESRKKKKKTAIGPLASCSRPTGNTRKMA